MLVRMPPLVAILDKTELQILVVVAVRQCEEMIVGLTKLAVTEDLA
jgi:hypothetical protein